MNRTTATLVAATHAHMHAHMTPSRARRFE
jgi:hypothetical protein